MSLKIQPYSHPSQFSSQRELFLNAFPEQKGQPAETRAHYEWKFKTSNLQGIQSFEAAAWEGDQMIGYYAALPFFYRIGKNRALAGMVCDVMTHSHARGKGIFTKLGRYSIDQLKLASFDFVSGFPIRPDVLPGHIKVGWKVAFKLPLYLRVFRADSILRSKGLSLFVIPINLGVRLYQGFFGVIDSILEIQSKEIGKRYRKKILSVQEWAQHPALERFIENWRNTVDNSLEKSTSFYQWRLGAPETNYKILTVEMGTSITAAAITRLAPLHGVKTLAVIDWMTLPDHPQAARQLHQQLRTEALQSGAEVIGTMMSATQAKKYGLLSAGFLRSPLFFRWIAQTLKTDGLNQEQIFSEANWNLMWIDSDDL